MNGWWQGLPGIDQRYAAPSREYADRMAALACAARIHPWDSSAGAYGSPKTRHQADVFYAWLQRAEGERAAYTARLALCIACTEIPAEAIHPSQYTHAATEIARYLVQDEPRGRRS